MCCLIRDRFALSAGGGTKEEADYHALWQAQGIIISFFWALIGLFGHATLDYFFSERVIWPIIF